MVLLTLIKASKNCDDLRLFIDQIEQRNWSGSDSSRECRATRQTHSLAGRVVLHLARGSNWTFFKVKKNNYALNRDLNIARLTSA